MIYAGIDVAKSSHVIGAVDERGKDAAKPMQFANSAGGFGKCAAYLEGLGAPAEEVLVGMEATCRCSASCTPKATTSSSSIPYEPMRCAASRGALGSKPTSSTASS